jgi:hypothetical protein
MFQRPFRFTNSIFDLKRKSVSLAEKRILISDFMIPTIPLAQPRVGEM